MTTNVHPETKTSPLPGKRKISLRARWRKRALLAIGAVAVVAIAAKFIPGGMSERESGSRLTHMITRGDLLVTVTEQGMLESSNNTEIKCKVRGYNTVIWVIEGGTVVEPNDVLVRLDTKRIEDAISLQTTNAWTASAALERSLANVATAELAIPAYLEGSYQTQLKLLERGLKIAETNLHTSQTMLAHTQRMFKRGYATDLEVEGNALTVRQAELELEVRRTEIDILEKYTKKMQMETLNGNLKANRSKLESDRAGLAMDEGRRDLVLKELKYCVIRAERSGLVIYPSAAEWKDTPDIEEGATVRKDQVLLLMPDLSNMQVKVGIHESIVDRIKPGLAARITLPDKTIEGEVFSVSSVTRPAGWWTGNVVKYDTIIKLPSVEGLKPGMSAEIEVVLDRHADVLTIPVAAVLETVEGDFCWVETAEGAKRRSLKLGDTDDSFIVVKAGLKEGDQVVLNPLAFIDQAQSEALKPLEQHSPESANESTQPVNTETDHVE